MKLLLISDIDDLRWKHGNGQADLILSCGDVADQVILEACKAYNCQKIFAVKGNHDSISQFPEPIMDLHMTVREFKGWKFGGLNGSWRYKTRGPYLYDQAEVCKFMSFFPPVDILICHNSPEGIHDRADGIHAGFGGLTAYLMKHSPKMLVHGHQHVDCETRRGETHVIGVYGFKMVEI